MASLNDLRGEIESLKISLAASNEEVQRLKQILSENLPNWEDGGSTSSNLPNPVDLKSNSQSLTKSKLTKEDIERCTFVPQAALICSQIQQTAYSPRTEGWRPGKVEGHLQQSTPLSNQLDLILIGQPNLLT